MVGTPFHLVLLQQPLINRVTALGHIYFNHHEVALRLVYHRSIVECDFLQFIARGAPCGIEINDDRFVQFPEPLSGLLPNRASR